VKPELPPPIAVNGKSSATAISSVNDAAAQKQFTNDQQTGAAIMVPLKQTCNLFNLTKLHILCMQLMAAG